MKISQIICALFLLTGLSASAKYKIQTDSLGLPGDNLDLYGVLDLFKKSENPEEFEKALNKEENKLNNLDLNNDNKIDYIYVIDKTESDAHALILRVAISETKTQDVAVIEIEKKGEENAVVQIVGDEALYGKNYIVEPADEKAPVQNTEKAEDNKTVIVNVYHWPAVRYIYRPAYVVYVSPWGWSHYPVWWAPWHPVYWSYYHPHWYPYHSYHRRVYTYRTPAAHQMYYGHRTPVNASPHKSNTNTIIRGPRKNIERVPADGHQTVKPRESRPATKPRQSGSQHSPAPRQKPQSPGGRRR